MILFGSNVMNGLKKILKNNKKAEFDEAIKNDKLLEEYNLVYEELKKSNY